MSGRARRRLALATSRDVPSLSPDDRLLLAPLGAHALAAEPVVWNDAESDWTGYAGVVIRSCWDYHHDFEQFESWTRRLETAGVPTWNPPELLRWNARKTYLRDLEAAGVPIVPTRFVDRGEPAELDDVLEDTGWSGAVVKPVVSASAHETWRTGGRRADDRTRFRRLVARQAVMVQPFLREIEEEGEWSLCFFGGDYSHAVIKQPAPGDFRVQSEHGGVYRAAEPGNELVEQAARALAAARSPTVYARVDGCVVGGTLCLMELELIEPALFLGFAAAAPERFAAAIAERVGAPA